MHSWTTAAERYDARCPLSEWRGMCCLCTGTEAHDCPLVEISVHTVINIAQVPLLLIHKVARFRKSLQFIMNDASNCVAGWSDLGFSSWEQNNPTDSQQSRAARFLEIFFLIKIAI